MAGVNDPEDFIAWQLCSELDDLIFELTATGPARRDFEFCNQIRGSAGGPAPNIAEGFGRGTPREFAHYLRMAVASLLETRTHLHRGLRKRYFTSEIHSKAATLCGRALDMTERLLASKVRQIQREDERRRRRGNKPGEDCPEAPSD